jgi:drug/metabolite transporter (DMT)-like permease
MINKPYFTLFISVISVSFAAIFIVSCSAHPLSIAFYRLLFTTLIIIPLVIFNKKTRKELKNIPYISIIIMAGIGLILAAHFSLWITSLKYTSVASSVILVAAHPFLVVPISHYFFKEKISLLNITGIILSVFGVIILVYGNYGFSSILLDSLEGNILALFGGIAAGFYILGGRKMRKNISVTSYAFIVYSISTIALLLICLLFNAPIYNISIRDYQLILLMAIISGIFGHTLYNWSLKYIQTSIVSVALLGEPLASTIFAYAIPWIHQVPSEFTIIGGTIIIIGIYLTTNKKINTNKK